jgi:hypothetical protein
MSHHHLHMHCILKVCRYTFWTWQRPKPSNQWHFHDNKKVVNFLSHPVQFSTVTRLWDEQTRVWYQAKARKGFLSSPQCPDNPWCPTGILFNGHRRALSLKVKWPVRVNHVLSSSAEVKNEWGYTSISLTKPSWQEQGQLYLFTFNSEFTNVQLQRTSFARLHVLTALLRDIWVLWYVMQSSSTQFPTFQMNIVPQLLWSSSPRRVRTYFPIFTCQYHF